MLDIGFPEFLLISFVLLIVVGPKDLPKVLRSIKSFISKIKSMASQFHSGIDDLANEAEISDLRKEVNKIDKRYSRQRCIFNNCFRNRIRGIRNF